MHDLNYQLKQLCARTLMLHEAATDRYAGGVAPCAM